MVVVPGVDQPVGAGLEVLVDMVLVGPHAAAVPLLAVLATASEARHGPDATLSTHALAIVEYAGVIEMLKPP